ncbi:MAG: S49 family peptidase [Candidatus Bathyarchaeia archaeon]
MFNLKIPNFKCEFKTVAVTAAIILLIAFSVVGYLYYSGFFALEKKKNMVGIISISGAILLSEQVDTYDKIIGHALKNSSIKAVVLRIDSPGGYADLIEEIYLDILELKKVKPVVASVTMALSGGYYIAVAADYIYAAPTSFVGNIGVIGVMPPTLIPSEIVIETGVYKATGFSKLLFPFNLSHALDNFASAVETGRGNRLKISPVELRRGTIYLGSEAVKLGLIDEIGALQKAISKAAEEAGLVEYDVIDLNEAFKEVAYSWGSLSSNLTLNWRNLTVEVLNSLQPPPSIWYLYLPSESSFTVLSNVESTTVGTSVFNEHGKGLVLIDKSHGNKVSTWDLDILIAELTSRNITVQFSSNWSNLASMLGNASCLIIASPTIVYSPEECNIVEDFVGRGGILLLFFDPAYEYLSMFELFDPINSIATRFGFFFAKGYLYNEINYYGFYRNIYVNRFKDSNVTRDLKSLVFFTATHIYPSNRGVAWSSENTYSSTAEKTGEYAVIAIVKMNGTVLAFSDQTFLTEPYCYVEDNYKLILNIVDLILKAEVKPTVKEVVEKAVEEITEPELPVGTVKEFIERIDGEEHVVKWAKLSEVEVLVEKPGETTHYYYDEKGSLIRVESDGIEIVYDTPIAAPPYPLTRGKTWIRESNYTMYLNGGKAYGKINASYKVEDFQYVEAKNGETYFCAKIHYTVVDEFKIGESYISMVSEGFLWVSREAGEVKEEYTVTYFVNSSPLSRTNVTLILKSIQKGGKSF